MNPAFELLKKYKKVDPDTEGLVLKRIKGRVSQDDLITIFEKGVAGEYGKFIVADPQTILSWVNQFETGKNSASNYLHAGLLPTNTKMTAHKYPTKAEEWHMEANKCYNAYLSGVDPSNFHPHVYDRMMLDGKIKQNDYLKHYNGNDEEQIKEAKQTILREVFNSYRSKNYSYVYLIAPNSK